MPEEEEMTIEEQYKYLRKMRQRYCRVGKKEKGVLLDEMEAVTGRHRKSLVRLMKAEPRRRQRQGQRGSSYSQEVQQAVFVVAESLDYICAERLTPNLLWVAQHLAYHGELVLDAETAERLSQIGVSTVRRILKPTREQPWKLPRKGPQPRYLAKEVPIGIIPWDEPEPGHLEADLVHHCGRSAQGEYLHTLQLVDVATGWSERVAIMGRSYLAVEEGLRRIWCRLPFDVLELHIDNGSEFLNHHLLHFLAQHGHDVALSRSRPYHKNDNRFVEQKNSTLVRAYLGYGRLDSPNQTVALNQLYELMWLYYNLFQPVMHMTAKSITPSPGGLPKVKRHYDQAQTPFDRACAAKALPSQRRQQLQQLRQDTNPRQLRQRIYQLRDQLLQMPNAGGIYDVRQIIAMVQQASVLPTTTLDHEEAAILR
mgnify:CR=1 FL=1